MGNFFSNPSPLRFCCATEKPSPSDSRLRTPLCGIVLLLFLSLAVPLEGREPSAKREYGLGFAAAISSSEATVLDAVEAVVNDGTIQGSKEYNKEKFIEKATIETSSPLFPTWSGGGKVYYKVRTKVLAPANFKEAQDEGTLAVRYVVQSKSATETVVRIDAIFEESFRHTQHASDGSVENAEYRDIQDHVDALELEKRQAAENEKHRQVLLAKQALERKDGQNDASTSVAALASAQTPEEHVQELRRQVERIIKQPGAQMKSAPFHSATNLKSLQGGSTVVILIETSYWYGIETEDGQHGWVSHSQLEPLP
jgi:hypothetical protein